MKSLTMLCSSKSIIEKFQQDHQLFSKKVIRLLLCCALYIFTVIVAQGQNQTAKMTPEGTGYWEYLPPDYNGNTDNYPVLIFFHGLGERGNGTSELNRVLTHGPPKHIKNGHEFPFIVISPQLSSSLGNWPPQYMNEVVEHVKTELRIDENRIYVSGLSLGGGGAWYYAQQFPEKIAAVAPVCGSRNQTSEACDIAAENIPVWAFHGDSDNVISVTRTISMVEAINACLPTIDPSAIMTIYPNVNHNSWDRAYRTDNSLHTPNLYEWLMQYSKSSISANAGADIALTLPVNSTNITGSGTSSAAITGYLWEKTTGSPATLTNANSATLSVGDMTEGIYTFRLTVTDSNGDTASDQVRVTVTMANQPPTANAGADIQIKLPTNSVTLTGSGSDSDGSITSYQWLKESGGNATLTGATTNSLNVSGMEVGVYIFSLTVTDNDGATAQDEVAVIVQDADNIPPTANAGNDIQISLPTNSINISGSGSDPDGSIASYLWEKSSGPACQLSNTTAATLSVTSLVAGSYTFRITVTDDDGDSDTDNVNVIVSAANQPPSVNAGNNINIALPTTSTNVAGSASDADGSIASYLWEQQDGPVTANITSSTTANSSINNLTAEGNYSFTLTVTDNDGASATDEITITVSAAPVNIPPVASAGNDVFITLPVNSVTLNGSGTDADGSIASYAWTKISGGTVNLSGQSTSTLQVSNLQAGDYRFRLTVTDNKGASHYDQVDIIVSPEDVNESPVASAGPNKVLTLPNNTTVLNGTGSDADGTIQSYSWAKTSGPSATLSGQNTAALTLTNLVEGVYFFEFTVTDDDGAIDTDIARITVNAANTPPTANAGNNIIITLPNDEVIISGSATDSDGTVAGYLWSQVSGPSTATLNNETTETLSAFGLTAGLYTFRLTVTDNQGATDSDDVNITVNEALNESPVASAGSDKSITLPLNSLNINGSAYDNDGTIASVIWTQTSGPGTATITNPGSLTVTISDLEAGLYVFHLTVVDDDGASDFDEVQVTVNPSTQNEAPTANAGTNKTVFLPTNSVTLHGSGSDTDGSIATYHWTKVSGPTSSLVNSSSPSLTVNNLVEGNYIFRLRITDNDGASHSDEVNVFVLPSTVNQPPTANAGADIALTLPVNSTTLLGSASDPDGSITNYNWAQVSGGRATLTNASSPSLTISDLEQGSYTFELTGTDNNSATGTDQVSVYVNVATANHPPTANAGADIVLNLPTNATTVYGSGTDNNGSITAYQWSKISGPGATLGNSTQPNLLLSQLIEGTYVFRLKVTDDDGATDTDEVTIFVFASTVNQPPIVSAGEAKTVKLPTNSITLKGTASDADGSLTSIVWTKISGGNASINSPNQLTTLVTNLEEGIYTFRLTATDDTDASRFDDVQVTVLSLADNTPPTANAGPDITIKLPDNSIEVTGEGFDSDGNITAYQWSKIFGPLVTARNLDNGILQLTEMVEGVYLYRLKVTDDLGDSDTDDIKITVLPATINTPPVVNAGTNKTVQLPQNSIIITGTASDDGTITEVLWSKVSGPSGDQMSGENTNTLTLTKLTVGSYRYRFTATDNDGVSVYDDVIISVLGEEEEIENLPPTVTAGPDQTLQLPNHTITLHAFANDPDDIVSSFLWSQISGPTDVIISTPDSSSITLTSLSVGRYTFKVEVKDLNDALASDHVDVIVLNANEMARGHKLFSPNNDGIDDYWIIDNVEAIDDCQIVIFNRRGEEVYQTRGYQNNWDGTSHGQPLPEGVYYYIVKCNSQDNSLTGSVTIVR